MYNLRHLSGIVRDGFSDMWPALRVAFNDSTEDDRMYEVYGSNPRIGVCALAILGAVLGMLFVKVGPNFQFMQYVSWPAVAVGLLFAAVIRRYLFSRQLAKKEDFPWLAASLAPAICLAVVIELIPDLTAGSVGSENDQARLGSVLVTLTQALSIAAAMTIAIATLCFSQQWPRALIDLATRLLVFRILVWVTTLVLIDIGIVGQLIGALVQGLTGWSLPQWLADLSDQLSYALLLTTVYLAIIGATWTVCRQNFGTLLETGQVDILKAIEKLTKKQKSKKPKKPKKPES